MVKIYLSSRAIIRRGKKILLIREEEHWETPGGKLEPDENPIQNVHREMKEELGTRVKILDRVPYFYKRVYKGNHTVMCYFFIKLLGKPKITKDNHEALEIKFLSKKEIMKLKREKNLMGWDSICLPKIMKELGL
ncbi:MAG: NUDIX hydrolase [Candidatus Aenigmatarchaeota archaeon]